MNHVDIHFTSDGERRLWYTMLRVIQEQTGCTEAAALLALHPVMHGILERATRETMLENLP